MKKIVFAALISMMFGVVMGMAGNQDHAAMMDKLKAELDGNAKAKPATKEFVKSIMADFCTNAIFVEEVQKQNAAGKSLSDIQALDTQWQDAEDLMDIMSEVMGNRCAAEIKRLANSNGAIIEMFVMDNQGAVVGENELTSDYWQGDEAKWQNSYKGGQGGVDVGDEKLDRSTNAVLQQVSLPIVTADGEVIGAVTIGLDVSKL